MRTRKKAKSGTISLAATILVIAAVCVYMLVNGQSGGNKPAQLSGKTGECELAMIDVGQGDALLLTCPEGNVLIDAGPDTAEKALSTYLKNAGVTSFEYVVFTHPHEDHIGGGDMIMKDYDVARVMMPDKTTKTACFEKLIEAIDASGAEFIIPERGDSYKLGKLELTVLSPSDTEYDGINAYSIVLRAQYGDVSMLLTGDAEGVNEREMLASFPQLLDCDILKVAHHGSEYSSTADFIAAATPAIALISCGEGNSYGHPHAKALERLGKAGAEIYRTDTASDTVVATDGAEYWLRGTQ